MKKKNCNVCIYKKHQVVAVMNYHPSVMLFFLIENFIYKEKREKEL